MRYTRIETNCYNSEKKNAFFFTNWVFKTKIYRPSLWKLFTFDLLVFTHDVMINIFDLVNSGIEWPRHQKNDLLLSHITLI